MLCGWVLQDDHSDSVGDCLYVLRFVSVFFFLCFLGEYSLFKEHGEALDVLRKHSLLRTLFCLVG